MLFLLRWGVCYFYSDGRVCYFHCDGGYVFLLQWGVCCFYCDGALSYFFAMVEYAIFIAVGDMLFFIQWIYTKYVMWHVWAVRELKGLNFSWLCVSERGPFESKRAWTEHPSPLVQPRQSGMSDVCILGRQSRQRLLLILSRRLTSLILARVSQPCNLVK